MTNDTSEAKLQLERLRDALVEDILNTADEEILAEATENYSDPDAVADRMRDLVNRAILDAGKAAMAKARSAVREDARQSTSNVVHLPVERKRALVNKALSDDPGLSQKLTAAARKGEELSERDLDSILEDLRELGVIDEVKDE